MNPNTQFDDLLFLVSPVIVFAIAAALEYAFTAWTRRAHRIRAARTPGSRVTRGLSDSDRALRQAALHLDRERERAIADLGTDWVLHPEHKREAAPARGERK